MIWRPERYVQNKSKLLALPCRSCPLGRKLCSGSNNWTYGTLPSTRNVGVRVNLAPVMRKSGVGDWTDIAILGLTGRGVVGRKNTGNGANDRTDCFVHGLLLWPADNLGQSWTLARVGEIGGVVKDAWVFMEIMVVVGGSWQCVRG